MKRTILMAFIILSFSSCTRKYTCHNSYDYVFQFFTYTSDTSIMDSIATVSEYVKGSNFTAHTYTFSNIPMGNFKNTLMANRYHQQYILFSKYTLLLKADPEYMFKYDRIITLHPSGRTYELRDISHNNRSIKNANNDEIACTNDVTYYANDSLYRIAGGQAPGSYGGDDIYYIKY